MKIRRVVMDELDPGASAFTDIQDLAPREARGGSALTAYDVWGWDDAPRLRHAASTYSGSSMFPEGAPGARVMVFTEFPPATPPAPPAATAEPARVAGMTRHGSEIPGLHSTDTVDIGVVVAGKVASITSDGTREVLGPGDIYIQNGGPHAWARVDGEEPATIAFVVIAATREDAG